MRRREAEMWLADGPFRRFEMVVSQSRGDQKRSCSGGLRLQHYLKKITRRGQHFRQASLAFAAPWLLLPAVLLVTTSLLFAQSGDAPTLGVGLKSSDGIDEAASTPSRLDVASSTSAGAGGGAKLAAPSASSGSRTLQYDVIADFGATCDGSADDAPAFWNAAVAMRANPLVRAGAPVVLKIPPGRTCVMASCREPGLKDGVPVFYGIPNFTLTMVGSKISSRVSSAGRACAGWAGQGIQTSAGTKALFDTVSSGASCVEMVTPGQESRFRVGSWVAATAVNLMGWGYPPNPAIYEYLQVASASSGRVCFTTPLQNSYSSTYPDYGLTAPYCGGQGCGGPATLYELDPNWNVKFSIIGGTWDYTSELYFVGRSITMTGVTMEGEGEKCYSPSTSLTVTLNDFTDRSCAIEVDKLIQAITFNRGSLGTLIVQSPSPVSLTLDHLALGALNGTPQNTLCVDSTIGTLAGGSVYGGSKTFKGINCAIGKIRPFGLLGNIVNGEGWTVSKGVFTNKLGFSAVHWATPGGRLFFTGAYAYQSFPFTITKMVQSNGFFSLYTTLTGDLPALPTSAGRLIVLADPYPNWSCTHCTGSPDAVDYSQAGAQNAPLYTYSNRIYTCDRNIAAVESANPDVPVLDIHKAPPVNVWGTLVYLQIDVASPDASHSDAAPFNVTSQYGNFPTISGSAVVGTFSPVINLKIAGTRIVTPSGVTGAQMGDKLTSPGAVSMTGPTDPYLPALGGDDPTLSCPVVTVTWQTSR